MTITALAELSQLVCYILIAINVLVFIVELGGGDSFIMKRAFIPSRFTVKVVDDLTTLFSSMFMNAGWLHLRVNMRALSEPSSHLPLSAF